MSNTKNLANLASVLDDGSAGQVLTSQGSGAVAFANAGGTGVTVHSNQAALLTDAASASEGSLHYDTGANKLFVKNENGGFFLLATITNTTPTITSFSENTGSAGANNLTTGGTFALTAGSNTVITINATDPDLDTLVYSATVTSGTASDVISSPSLPISNQSGNTFTLVPATSGSGGSITVRFDVSDNNNIANVTHSFSIQFSITDSNFTRLLMATDDAAGGNQTILDSHSTTTPHIITINGDAHAGSFSPYRHGGYSASFDGADDTLTLVGSGSAISTARSGSGFTIEGWYYPDAASAGFDMVYGQSATNGYATAGALYYNAGNASLYYAASAGGGSPITSSEPWVKSTWNHFAVTSTGSTLKLYINGVLGGSVTNTNFSGTADLQISHTNYDLHGFIKDFRISNTVRYSGNSLTIPTKAFSNDTNTLLLCCHLPYFADGSSNAHTITTSGDPEIEPISPYDNDEYSKSTHGGSVSFDGLSDSLQFTANADLRALGRTGTAATIEAWVYLNSTPSTYGTAVYSLGTAGSTGGNNVLSFEIQNNRTLRAAVNGGYSSLTGMVISTGTVPLKIWTHIALVLNSGTWTTYINGVADGTVSGYYPSGANHSTAYVGRCFYGSDRDADMVVADLRITSDAQYTSNFTPPTAPLTTVSNTKLHLKGTDAHVLDKSQVGNLKLAGGAAASTTQAKFGSTASVAFDGSGDFVQTPTSSIYNLGTQAFTVECFFRINTDVQNALVYFLNGSTNVLGTFYYHTNNSIGVYDSGWITGNAGSGSNHNILSLDTWHFLAVSRDNSTLRVYIDGTQVHSVANTTDYTCNNIRLGQHQYGSDLNGYLQDVRISIGKARYTGSTLTVPTSSLKG